MGALFTTLFAKVSAVVSWVSALWVAIFVALWDLGTDAVCWVFENAMKIAVSAAAGLDVSAMTSQVTQWGALPAEVLNVLGLLGVGTAVAIISSAIGIRMVLQLIPFVRLGS